MPEFLCCGDESDELSGRCAWRQSLHHEAIAWLGVLHFNVGLLKLLSITQR